MERLSKQDIKQLNEAYTNVQMYNEGMWDRVKAGAKGLAANVKTKAGNAVKFGKNVAQNTGNALKGLAGDNNALDKIKQNNINTNKQYKSAGTATLDAKQQSLIDSHSKKIDNAINNVSKLVQDFNSDLIKMKITNNPTVGDYINRMYNQMQQLAQKTLNSVSGYETSSQQNAEDEEYYDYM